MTFSFFRTVHYYAANETKFSPAASSDTFSGFEGFAFSVADSCHALKKTS